MLHRVEDIYTLGLQMSNSAAVIQRHRSELAATMAGRWSVSDDFIKNPSIDVFRALPAERKAMFGQISACYLPLFWWAYWRAVHRCPIPLGSR